MAAQSHAKLCRKDYQNICFITYLCTTENSAQQMSRSECPEYASWQNGVITDNIAPRDKLTNRRTELVAPHDKPANHWAELVAPRDKPTNQSTQLHNFSYLSSIVFLAPRSRGTSPLFSSRSAARLESLPHTFPSRAESWLSEIRGSWENVCRQGVKKVTYGGCHGEYCAGLAFKREEHTRLHQLDLVETQIGSSWSFRYCECLIS